MSSDVADAKQLEIIRRGSSAWNEWRLQNPLDPADLRGADLRKVNLTWANLREADLSGADLSRADLRGADLREADVIRAKLVRSGLSGADLRWADLRGADFAEADLIQTDLSLSDLRWTNLRQAQLRDANFVKAMVGWTAFYDVDLSPARGLESVRHLGPSSIGIDTLYKSGGRIADVFLRGAGVPDTFIAYAESLTASPIEFHSCFISYCNQDFDFADRLRNDLVAKGLRCWFAPEDLKIGDRFQERIEESIRVFDKVMIILSHASVASRWVEREVNAAWEREQSDTRTVLFPIRIDDAVMEAPQPWAADLRRCRHIGDFRAWQDPAVYRKSLDRLLRDLRNDGAGRP